MLTFVVGRIDARAFLDEKLSNVELPSLAGLVEWSVTFIVLLVYICTLVDKKFD